MLVSNDRTYPMHFLSHFSDEKDRKLARTAGSRKNRTVMRIAKFGIQDAFVSRGFSVCWDDPKIQHSYTLQIRTTNDRKERTYLVSVALLLQIKQLVQRGIETS